MSLIEKPLTGDIIALKHMCPNSHIITTKCEAYQVHHQQVVSWCFPSVPSSPVTIETIWRELSHEDSRWKRRESSLMDTGTLGVKGKKKIKNHIWNSNQVHCLCYHERYTLNCAYTRTIHTSQKSLVFSWNRYCNYLKGMEGYTAESPCISPCKSNACTWVQSCMYASRTWTTTALHYLGHRMK